MSQPCCFAHHNVTAESIPPDRRMIARSMMTVYVCRDSETARPRAGGFRSINICPRPVQPEVKTALRDGGRRQVIRVPQDPEFVLDSLDRFALPLHEPLAVPVAEDD